MRKICRLFTLLMFVSMCISCKTNESLNSTRIVKSELDDNKEIYCTQITKSGLDYNLEWQKTIENSKVQAKECWKKNQRIISSEPILSDVEKENAKTLLVPKYRILKSTLLRWDTLAPIQDMMTLCIDTAVLYVFPNGRNPWQAHFAYKDGDLNLIKYFGLTVIFDDINELYFKKHLPFINVDVLDNVSKYRWHFIVFIDEKGELMSISFRKITPFKEILKSYLKPNSRID